MKVLICPEDMTQMKLGKKFVYDRLPKDVQKRVVWKSEYWLTDEALSTYLQSAGPFASEIRPSSACLLKCWSRSVWKLRRRALSSGPS